MPFLPRTASSLFAMIASLSSFRFLSAAVASFMTFSVSSARNDAMISMKPGSLVTSSSIESEMPCGSALPVDGVAMAASSNCWRGNAGKDN